MKLPETHLLPDQIQERKRYLAKQADFYLTLARSNYKHGNGPEYINAIKLYSDIKVKQIQIDQDAD